LEVTIYEGEKGPIVTVRGSVNDSPEKVAKAYKDAYKELTKEEENNAK